MSKRNSYEKWKVNENTFLSYGLRCDGEGDGIALSSREVSEGRIVGTKCGGIK